MFESTRSCAKLRDEPVLNSQSGSGGVRCSQSGLFIYLKGGFPQEPRNGPLKHLARVCKRAFDMSLASITLSMLAPVFLLAAISVKLSSTGPVFCRELRYGEGGRQFRIYRFRCRSDDVYDAARLDQIASDDEHITPVGRFLRTSNIDQLPQLYNILIGDMSFIGPRAHPVGLLAEGCRYDELVPYYHLRHSVKPGLSGWAQINDLCGPTCDAHIAQARIDHDIAYVQNFSLLLDFRIAGMTIWRDMLCPRNRSGSPRNERKKGAKGASKDIF